MLNSYWSLQWLWVRKREQVSTPAVQGLEGIFRTAYENRGPWFYEKLHFRYLHTLSGSKCCGFISSIYCIPIPPKPQITKRNCGRFFCCCLFFGWGKGCWVCVCGCMCVFLVLAGSEMAWTCLWKLLMNCPGSAIWSLQRQGLLLNRVAFC